MTIDVSSLTVEQALGMALKSEVESADVYKKLKKVVKNVVMRDKLQFLIGEEKKHQKVVEELFHKMFPDKKIVDSGKSLVPRLSVALGEENSVVDLLELAMEAEKMFEEFYENLSEEVEERGA